MNKRNIYTIGIIAILIVLGLIFSSSFNKKSTSIESNSEVQPSTEVSASAPYTLAEISTHNESSDCFMAIDGKVYDVTEYIASGQHNPQILKGCGQDATEMFNQERKHSGGKSQALLAKYVIGVLK